MSKKIHHARTNIFLVSNSIFLKEITSAFKKTNNRDQILIFQKIKITYNLK
jgi:hypothetical protein